MDFINRLLSRYQENRLGVEGSVKEHCWFKETDWSLVTMRKIEAPHVPGDRSQDWVKEEENIVKKTQLVILKRQFLKIFEYDNNTFVTLTLPSAPAPISARVI